MPALLAGAKTSTDGKARIIATSSFGHYAGSLRFDTFTDGPERTKAGTEYLYNQTKFVSFIF
jgi:retinol dehydrogenase 12